MNIKHGISKTAAVICACAAMLACSALFACGNGTSAQQSASAPSSSSSAAASSSAEVSSSSSNSVAAAYGLVSAGKLKVATCANNAPMEFQEGGNIKGFDVDIIKELARRLGLDASIESQSSDSLLACVSGEAKYDCAISSIAITELRQAQASFSDSYYEDKLAIVVRADSACASSADLAGQSVCARRASLAEEWVASNLPSNAYTPFQEESDMLGALEIGTIAAAVLDEAKAEYMISNDYKDCKIIEVIPTGVQYGIAVGSNKPELLSALNGALADMKADGTYDKIYKQWFSLAQ